MNRIARGCLQVHCTVSMGEILIQSEAPGCVISPRSETDGELARQVIETGKNVLVERPVSLDIREEEQLVELTDRCDTVYMVDSSVLPFEHS